MLTTGQQLIKRRYTEWTVSILTISIVVLTAITYFLDLKKSNWLCGPALLVFEMIAIGIQCITTFIVWQTDKKVIKTITLMISVGISTFIIWGFINFLTKCS
jgi:hypothetical protein